MHFGVAHGIVAKGLDADPGIVARVRRSRGSFDTVCTDREDTCKSHITATHPRDGARASGGENVAIATCSKAKRKSCM